MQVVLAKMLDELECLSLGPVGISPPCFSFTKFIVGQCLLKKTSRANDPVFDQL